MINKLQLNIKRDKQLARFYADEKYMISGCMEKN